MQEDEWFLVNDDEERVHELAEESPSEEKESKVNKQETSIRTNLRELGQDEELDPQSGAAASVARARVGAQVVPEGHVGDVMKELGRRSEHPQEGEGRQEQIPRRHGLAPVPARPAGEVLLSSHNQDTVQDARPDGNHGMALHPVKYGGGIIVLFKPVTWRSNCEGMIDLAACLQPVIGATEMTGDDHRWGLRHHC
jgi:hypothetical protein